MDGFSHEQTWWRSICPCLEDTQLLRVTCIQLSVLVASRTTAGCVTDQLRSCEGCPAVTVSLGCLGGSWKHLKSEPWQKPKGVHDWWRGFWRWVGTTSKSPSWQQLRSYADFSRAIYIMPFTSVGKWLIDLIGTVPVYISRRYALYLFTSFLKNTKRGKIAQNPGA